MPSSLAGALSQGDGGTLPKKLRLRSHIASVGFLALVKAIGSVAVSTSALEELDLGHTIDIANDVDDFTFGMYPLFSVAKIKHLDLEGSHIGRHAGMSSSDVIIAHGGCLKMLKCQNNALEDEAMIHYLASTLGEYKALKHLDLNLNYGGLSGGKA